MEFGALGGGAAVGFRDGKMRLGGGATFVEALDGGNGSAGADPLDDALGAVAREASTLTVVRQQEVAS
jgi:hypothetical protein